MAQAAKLRHPFAEEATLELDAEFVAEAMVRLWPIAGVRRSRIMSVVRSLKKALLPMDRHGLMRRPVGHVKGIAPAFLAAMVVIFGWRDSGLPAKLVFGFGIAGDTQPCGVFRELHWNEARGEISRDELLGAAAEKFVDELEADTRVHESAADILKETDSDIELGFASGYGTRQDLDERFGRGGWRPLPRYPVYQADKARPIDDGWRAGRNSAATMRETIVCQTGEFLALAARKMTEIMADILSLDPAAPWHEVAGKYPDWFALDTGVEDMWKGFRQNRTTEEDLALSIITFVHPHTRRRVYIRLNGLPFGQGPVVNQFNRVPMVFTSMLRGVLGCLSRTTSTITPRSRSRG